MCKPLFLLNAAKAGDLDTVKRLIDEKHNVNQRSIEGWTPLLKACKRGHLTIAKLLVEKGASVHQESTSGCTTLMQASAGGHVDVVEWLIKEGVEVDKCQKHGETALWNAASNGHLNCCELLVSSGANVTHANSKGRPVLIQAAFMLHIDVVAFLIAKGADPKAIDQSDGRTLFLAASRGRSCTVEPSSQDSYHERSLELVEWVLKNVEGIDVNEVDRSGRNAMDGPIARNNLALAKRLLELGCEIPKNVHQMKNSYKDDDKVLVYLRSLKPI